MYIRSDKSLITDGHSFDDITVNGPVIAQRMFIAAAGTDSTGKPGKIAIFLNGFSIGPHSFSKDPGNGTYINVINEAGKKGPFEGSWYYSTCEMPATESTAIHVLKAQKVNGKAKGSSGSAGKW